MAEDVKSKDVKADDQDNDQKTFTQSDFDKLIGKEKKRIEDRYKDYDDLKSQVDSLLKEKKEKELADKTEIEKLQIQFKEATDKMSVLEDENNNMKKLNIRNEILLDPKFNHMPRAYKNLVELSNNKDDVIRHAESILEEYYKDTGKDKNSFSGPVSDIVNNGNAKQRPKSLAQQVKDNLKKRGESYLFGNRK